MSRCGDIYQNKVTGEQAVVVRGDEDGRGQPGLVHLTARPHGAVVGEHIHPQFKERFRVVKPDRDISPFDADDSVPRPTTPAEEATRP